MEIYTYMINIYTEISKRYQRLCTSSFPCVCVVKGKVVRRLKPELWGRFFCLTGFEPQICHELVYDLEQIL